MEILISEILGHTNRQAATHLTRGGAVPNAKWHTLPFIRGPHAGPFAFHQNLQLGALGRILERQADLGGGHPKPSLGAAPARPGFTLRIRRERRMPALSSRAMPGPCTGTCIQVIIGQGAFSGLERLHTCHAFVVQCRQEKETNHQRQKGCHHLL